MSDQESRWEILYRASREISASLSLEELYTAILNAAEMVMPCDDFIIDGYDERTNEIVPLYIIEPVRQRAYPPRYIADHGLAGGIVHSGKAVILNSPEEIEASGIRFESYGSARITQSLIAVPMKLHGRTIGILSAQSYLPHAYTSGDQKMLEVLASHAAIALENVRLFQQLKEAADTDPLTGILNRRKFFEYADLEFIRARRYKRRLAVIMIDIDHFKQFNDQHGHRAGDDCLQFVVRQCLHQIRAMDFFGRYGGEEFILLLPDTDLEGALQLAERLRVEVSAGRALPADQPVTISLGIAEIDPSCERIEDLIERADQALYRAKHEGRNRVEIWMDR